MPPRKPPAGRRPTSAIAQVPDDRLDQLTALFQPEETRAGHRGVRRRRRGTRRIEGALRSSPRIAMPTRCSTSCARFTTTRCRIRWQSIDPGARRAHDRRRAHPRGSRRRRAPPRAARKRSQEDTVSRSRRKSRKCSCARARRSTRAARCARCRCRRRRCAAAARISAAVGASRCCWSSTSTKRDGGGGRAQPLGCPALAAFQAASGAGIVGVCAKIELEIAQLDPDDARAFMADLGLAQSGLDRVIRAAYDLLGYISFFTVGEDECRAWSIPRDTPRGRSRRRDSLGHPARLHPRGGLPLRPSARARLARRAVATTASCGSKARTTPSPTAT